MIFAGLLAKMSTSSLCVLSDGEQECEALAQQLCLHTANAARPVHNCTVHTDTHHQRLLARCSDDLDDCRTVVYVPAANRQYTGRLRQLYSCVRALVPSPASLVLLDAECDSARSQAVVDDQLNEQRSAFELPLHEELELLTQYAESAAGAERMEQLRAWLRVPDVSLHILMPNINKQINLPADEAVQSLIQLLSGGALTNNSMTGKETNKIAFYRSFYRTEEEPSPENAEENFNAQQRRTSKPPNVHWPISPSEDELQLSWRFTFPSCPLPRPLFDRLLDRCQQRPADHCYRWVNGTLLTHDPLRICIVRRRVTSSDSSSATGSPIRLPAPSSSNLAAFRVPTTGVTNGALAAAPGHDNHELDAEGDVDEFDVSLRIDPDELVDITDESPVLFAWKYFGAYVAYAFDMLAKLKQLPYQAHVVGYGSAFFARPCTGEHVFHVTELLAACQKNDDDSPSMTSFTQYDADGRPVDNQINAAICFGGERVSTLCEFAARLQAAQQPTPPRSPMLQRDMLGTSLTSTASGANNALTVGNSSSDGPRRASFGGRRVSFGVVAVQGVTVKSIEDPIAATNLFALGFVQECFSDLFDELDK